MNQNQINRSFNNRLFVRLGYGDMFDLGVRSLDFRTQAVEVNEACELIKIVKGYNYFNGQKVAETVKKIAQIWLSDHQQITFSFGRESSPVLYIHFPYWKSNTERFENRDELIKESLKLLQTCQPDELDEELGGFRAWWD